LHRSIYIRNDHGLKDYQKIWESDDSTEDKIKNIKKWVKTKYGIQLPDKPSGTYQPGGHTSSFGDGFRTFERWDLTADQVEDSMDDYVLQHTIGGLTESEEGRIVGTIDSILQSGGELTSTTSRIRKGVSISKTGGESSGGDIKSGGASYLFTRIKDNASANERRGLFFKSRNLSRQDILAYGQDEWGNIEKIKKRGGTLDIFKKFGDLSGRGGDHSGNEACLKNGINLLDEIEYIRVFHEEERQALLKVFKKNKVDVLPDGRRIKDIILITGEWHEVGDIRKRILSEAEHVAAAASSVVGK